MRSNTLLSAATLIAGISAFENQAEEFIIEHNNPLQLSSPQTVAAFGNAVVVNRCPYEIYLWSVDEKNDPKTPTAVIPGGGSHTEVYRQPCPGCGISLKVSLTQEMVGGPGGKLTQFEYGIDNDQIYYDISFVDCAKGESAETCPGHDKGLSIGSAEPSCIPLHCAAGTYCVNDAYYVDDPDKVLGIPAPVKGCDKGILGMDVVFTMCSDA